MNSNLLKSVWQPFMQGQHKLPCKGVAEGPLWHCLLRHGKHSAAARVLPGRINLLRQLHTQSDHLTGQRLDTCAARKRMSTSPLGQSSSEVSAKLPSQFRASHAAGIVGRRQGWLKQSMLGLRHKCSRSMGDEQMSAHSGLRRSVRLAASSDKSCEAGFVKGAGVVTSPSQHARLPLCTACCS